MGIQDWFLHCEELICRERSEYQAVQCLCITLWFLWQWRNNYVFEGEILTLTSKIAILRREYCMNYKAWKGMNKVQKQRTLVAVSWVPPRDRWLKLKTDGASQLAGESRSWRRRWATPG